MQIVPLLINAPLVFGYDQGIIGSTIAQPTFVDYFDNPTPSAQGGIVSSFSGGGEQP